MDSRVCSRFRFPRVCATVVLLGALLCALSAAAASGAAARSRLPRLGQLPNPTIGNMNVGVFKPIGRDLLSTTNYYGLPFSDMWFDALLYDSNGNYFLATPSLQRINGTGPIQASPAVIAVQSSPLGLTPDPAFRSWQGTATETLAPHNQVQEQISDGVSTQTVILGPRRISWNSQDSYIHLNGKLTTPGLNWILHWHQPDGTGGEMYYAPIMYQVSGTYHGRTVHGFVMVEHVWSASNYASTWWVQNRIGHWMTFVNAYKNGTHEFGDLLCGEYGFRAAVVANDHGLEFSTKQINDYIHPDPSGIGGQIHYELGNGQQFQYVENPDFSLPGSMLSSHLGFGNLTRIGDPRLIDDSWADNDIFQHNCNTVPLH